MAKNAFESDFRSSKMAAGSHKKKSCVLIWNGEKCDKSDLRSSKMAAGSHFVKKNQSCVFIWNGEQCDQKWFSVIQNGRWQPFCEQKSRVLIWNGEKCDRKWFSVIQNGRRKSFCRKKSKLRSDLKWPEMWSKSSKMAAGSHFVNKIQKKSCVLIWNGEKCDQSDFRSSKMAAGSNFVKKKSCVLILNGEKCDQKWFSVIQNGRWQPFCDNKSCVLIWNDEKYDESDFCEQNKKLSIDLKWREMRLVIQNGRRYPFCEKKLRIALKWREVRSKFIFGHPKWGGGGSQWPACKPFGDIHSICPWANTPILVRNCYYNPLIKCYYI